jgi:hypothetical protein
MSEARASPFPVFISILHGLMVEESAVSSFFPHFFLSNFLPALPCPLDVFQDLAEPPCAELSYRHLRFKLKFQDLPLTSF